jgi:hypothetical protein
LEEEEEEEEEEEGRTGMKILGEKHEDIWA